MTQKTKVTGIGGVFFKVKDPAATRAWYAEHLGLPCDAYGALFRFREEGSGEPGQLQWSPFAADTTYFEPSKQPFMINYRVADLDGLLAQLVEAGIEIVGEIQDEPYGRFAHLMDPEGNKIELWEPKAEDCESE